MWYRGPASEWKQGLPIGNGVLGAMVLGGTSRERIALNHEWLWRAQNRHRTTEPKHERLGEVRKLFFEGKPFEAGTLANEVLGGVGGVSGKHNRVDPYQPAGDLLIETPEGEVTNYRRELDLATGVVKVEYSCSGKPVKREIFAHASLPVICLRISGDCDAGPGVHLALARIDDPDCSLSASSTQEGMDLTGTFIEGSRFMVSARVIPSQDQVCAPMDGAGFQVCCAGETLVLITIAVCHDGEPVEAKAEGQIEGVPTTWDELLGSHLKAYEKLYGRVRLRLGDPRDDVPHQRASGVSPRGQARQ